MDDNRKRAYRYLIYYAMLDIRQLVWRNVEGSPDPQVERDRLRAMSFIGALADWMHNLAAFSKSDFAGFDEERFWNDLGRLVEQYPDFQPERYCNAWETRMAEGEKEIE